MFISKDIYLCDWIFLNLLLADDIEECKEGSLADDIEECKGGSLADNIEECKDDSLADDIE